MTKLELTVLLLSFAEEHGLKIHFNLEDIKHDTCTVDFILGDADKKQLDFIFNFRYNLK
tara:strand:- start:518 stop:694 length:177 start_codon:yes stop_codon:yes gene_type:complete